VPQPPGPVEHVVRVGQQEQPELGGGDPPRRPVEQRAAEVVLQRLHAPAQQRLSDAQPVGRAGEVGLVGHRDERGQVREQVHINKL
jgi:hypothetical protein